MTAKFTISLDDETFRELEWRRGDTARSEFIGRVLKHQFDVVGQPATAPRDETPRPSPAGRKAKTKAASEGQRDRPAAASPSASRPSAPSRICPKCMALGGGHLRGCPNAPGGRRA